MARVRSMKTMPSTTRLHPTEVDCEIRVVESARGAAFIQLSTFGSDSRKSDKKVSQTVQLRESDVRALCRLLGQAFGEN